MLFLEEVEQENKPAKHFRYIPLNKINIQSFHSEMPITNQLCACHHVWIWSYTDNWNIAPDFKDLHYSWQDRQVNKELSYSTSAPNACEVGVLIPFLTKIISCSPNKGILLNSWWTQKGETGTIQGLEINRQSVNICSGLLPCAYKGQFCLPLMGMEKYL